MRALTTTPHEFPGERYEAGTIAVGKRENLVLPGTNPLVIIANISRNEGVVIQDRWLSKSRLQAMPDKLSI